MLLSLSFWFRLNYRRDEAYIRWALSRIEAGIYLVNVIYDRETFQELRVQILSLIVGELTAVYEQ